jgi:hypothetical protein
MQNIKEAAQPILEQGRDATIPIILDGENAWEYYPQSGRLFLRRFYDALQSTPGVEAVTVSEAMELQVEKPGLKSLVPGSWINANFNVWIGAPEDNRAWDYLYHAREFYSHSAARATEEKRKLAFEEILIAEGSDWNWWYGPEHHSANDRDFDELYRKHLSNVYQALGATPPEYLAQPIIGAVARPSFIPQTAFIHPRIAGDMVRYFEWIGAAMYTADQRSGSMHGKSFVLDSVYAGIDKENVYGRLDFVGGVPDAPFELVVHMDAQWPEAHGLKQMLRLDVAVKEREVQAWTLSKEEDESKSTVLDQRQIPEDVKVVVRRNFEFKMPLKVLLEAEPSPTAGDRKPSLAVASKLRLRFSFWQNRLPVDALPLEGWIQLQLLSERELAAGGY